MKKILQLTATCLLLFLFADSHAQNPPLFSQFFANPYQFNPSFVGSNGFTEANIFYRKQWLGIDNAPTSAAINIQTPIGRSVSLGLNAYSDKSILLTNTSVLATFGYRIRFGYMHHLNFGISGGVGFNNFDLSALEDTNDPALVGITESNTYLNGQVGLNYQWRNLNIGVSLPKLFDSRPNSAEAFNEVEFDKLEYRFGTVSYAIPVGQTTITPSVVYRALDASQDQLEGALIANYRNIFWIGGSYRQDYGVTGFVGINVKGLLRIGYAYEKATGNIADVVDGSHEIYLGARLGKTNREQLWADEKQKKDSLRVTTPKPAQQKAQEVELAENETKEEPEVTRSDDPPPMAEQTRVEPEVTRNAPVTTTQVEPPVRQVVRTEPRVTEKEETVAVPPAISEEEARPESPKDKPLQPGFYVVVGVYKVADNALHEISNLRARGMQPSILYNPMKDYYYVYTFKSLDRGPAVLQLQTLKRQNRFFAAWIFTVE